MKPALKNIIWIAVEAVAILGALLCLFGTGGCAQHISIETLTKDGVEYRSEVKQNLFLWYKTKPIEHVTPYSSIVIGDVQPDPNTAKAVIEGAVEAVIGGGV